MKLLLYIVLADKPFLFVLPASAMTSLQDTNIIKAVCSATSARKNGITIPVSRISTMSDKRKFDAFMGEAEELGCDDIAKALSVNGVGDAVTALQQEVERKKPRLQEMQKEVCIAMKPFLAKPVMLIMSSAIGKVDAAKRARNAARRVELTKLFFAKIEGVMAEAIEGQKSLSEAMLTIESIVDEHKDLMKPDGNAAGEEA